MDGIAGWLANITWPLVSRLLAALGFGYVTYEGATTAVNGALSAAKASMGGMTSDVLQLITMAGFFDFMSITSGGLISGLAWITLKKIALHTTGSGA